MHRHPQIVGSVIIGVILWGGLAQAQFQGGGPRGRGGLGAGPPGAGGILMTVMNPPVQKEIRLDDEGSARVRKIIESYVQESQSEWVKAGFGPDTYRELAALPREEQAAKRQEIDRKTAAIFKTLTEKFVPQLKAALSKEQFERVQQIDWQVQGSRALLDEAYPGGSELARLLEITKQQQEKIAGIARDYDQKQGELRRSAIGEGGRGGAAPNDIQALRAKMQELDKERDARTTDVLSKEQQEKYARLKGKAFDVAQLGQGGFGGRRGPGGGLLDGFAQAQPGRGPGGFGGFGRGGGFGMGGPGMGGLVALGGMAPVQKDLDLKEEMIGKVQKLNQEYMQEMQSENEKAGLGFAAFGQLQGLDPDERVAKMREMNEKRTE